MCHNGCMKDEIREEKERFDENRQRGEKIGELVGDWIGNNPKLTIGLLALVAIWYWLL